MNPKAKAKPLMSEQEFAELMVRLNEHSIGAEYSDKSREAARLVLVTGANQSQAAAQLGLTSQSVNQLMKRIRRRMESLPDGWVQVKGWFPAEVAKQLEALSLLLQEAQKSGQPLDMAHYSIALTQN